MSDLVARGMLALRTDGANLRKVAAALLDDSPVPEGPKPQPAPVIPMTDELVHALGILPAVFGKVQPTAVRTLSDEESRTLRDERAAIDEILKVLETRKSAIRGIVYNHLDKVAENEGVVSITTERDEAGHYIIARPKNPERAEIPGTTKEWSREYRAGSVTIEGARLKELLDAGDIDRATYLAFTREVRVFDEAKAFEAISKDPGLLGVLRKITKKGRASTSLFIRNKKK